MQSKNLEQKSRWSDYLYLGYTNIRSANNKILDIRSCITLRNLDILVLIETWLSSETPSEIFRLPEYTIHRRDRKSRGGGIMIATRNELRVQEVNTNSQCELLAVDIYNNNNTRQSLRIIAAYNPKASDTTYLKELLIGIAALIESKQHYIILGDFNINYSQTATNNICHQSQIINDFTSEHWPIEQLLTMPTRGSNIIDYLLTNKATLITNIEYNAPISSSDHEFITFIVKLQQFKTKHRIQYQNFNDAKYDDISETIIKNMQTTNNSTANANQLWRQFYKAVWISINNHITTRSVYKFKQNNISNKCFALFKKYNRLYRKYKASGNHRYKLAYKRHKYTFKRLIKYDKIQQEQKLLSQPNSRNFFRYIRNVLKPKATVSTIITNSNTSLRSDDHISDAFNEFFSSSYKNDSFENVSVGASDSNGAIVISESLIKKALTNVKHSGGKGIDSIPMVFWTNSIPYIIAIIKDLFNKIANGHYYPTEWSTNLIIPIYKKKGDANRIQNYRLISLLCTIARIYEYCIYLIIKPILEPLLNDKQHGFRANKSTLTNLIDSYHLVYKTLDSSNPIDMVTIDLSKAFDTIDRSLLMKKLKAKGIKEPLLKAIETIIKNRQQRVLHNESISKAAPITSGVPQGSVLSPLLFATYIDDLLSDTQFAYVVSYADDIKILSSSCESLQKEIDKIYKWSLDNRMSINATKCESIYFGAKNTKSVYYINNSPIPQVSCLRDLGVLIDDKLTFHEHIQKTRQKYLKLIGLIFKTVHTRDHNAYLRLYNSCIIPVIEYGATLYSLVSQFNITLLEGIQRKFTKRLFIRTQPHCAEVPSYLYRLKLYSLHTLKARHQSLDVITVYKIIKGTFPIQSFRIHRSLRRDHLIIISPIKTALFRNSFFHRSITNWNKKIVKFPTSLPQLKRHLLICFS